MAKRRATQPKNRKSPRSNPRDKRKVSQTIVDRNKRINENRPYRESGLYENRLPSHMLVMS